MSYRGDRSCDASSLPSASFLWRLSGGIGFGFGLGIPQIYANRWAIGNGGTLFAQKNILHSVVPSVILDSVSERWHRMTIAEYGYAPVVSVCLCCGKIHHDGEEWHDGVVDETVEAQSHTYCPQCIPAMIEQWSPEKVQIARERGLI